MYVDFARDVIEGDDGNGAARSDNSRWMRLTERRARTAEPIFRFDVQGGGREVQACRRVGSFHATVTQPISQRNNGLKAFETTAVITARELMRRPAEKDRTGADRRCGRCSRLPADNSRGGADREHSAPVVGTRWSPARPRSS